MHRFRRRSKEKPRLRLFHRSEWVFICSPLVRPVFPHCAPRPEDLEGRLLSATVNDRKMLRGSRRRRELAKRYSWFDGSHWVFDDPQTHIFTSFFFQFSSQISFIDSFRITGVFFLFKIRLNPIKNNSFKFYSSANERKSCNFFFFFIYEGKNVKLN